MKKYRDHYFLKAKEENYPARSIYKLQEMDNRYKIFHSGMNVLDLGASPGSWTLYAERRIGKNGKIVACDLKVLAIPLSSRIIFFQDDIFLPSDNFLSSLSAHAPFNVIMSDMAPATTGNKLTDQARSADLVNSALLFSERYLKNGGHFIAKLFMSPELEIFQKKLRESFVSVKIFKPKSSRSESKEIFLIGLNKTASADNDPKSGLSTSKGV